MQGHAKASILSGYGDKTDKEFLDFQVLQLDSPVAEQPCPSDSQFEANANDSKVLPKGGFVANRVILLHLQRPTLPDHYRLAR